MRSPLFVFPTRQSQGLQMNTKGGFLFFVRLPSGEQIKPRHLPIRAADGVFNNRRRRRKKKMNEIGKEFLEHWDEFKMAVLKTIPQLSKCDDPVEILKHSGQKKLTDSQIDKLEMLRDIHDIIKHGMERGNIGVEDAISTCLNAERIDYIKQIMVSI